MPKNRSKGVLPLSEAGMKQLAAQITEVLARAETETMAKEISTATYARLASVLVRIAEAGLKCDKYRKDQRRKKDGDAVGQASLQQSQGELDLL